MARPPQTLNRHNKNHTNNRIHNNFTTFFSIFTKLKLFITFFIAFELPESEFPQTFRNIIYYLANATKLNSEYSLPRSNKARKKTRNLYNCQILITNSEFLICIAKVRSHLSNENELNK